MCAPPSRPTLRSASSASPGTGTASAMRRPRNAWTPPSLPEVGREGGPAGAGQSEPGRQSPGKMVGELDSPEDLSHQLRRPTAPGVGHDVRIPALTAAVGAGGGDGGGQRN